MKHAFNQHDLDKLERSGIPTETLLEFLRYISKRGTERMTPGTKRKLLDNRDKTRSLSRSVEKVRRKVIEFVEADPFLGVQTPAYNLDDKPMPPLALKVNPATPAGKYLDGMKALADLLNEESSAFGAMSRRNAHAYRGVDTLLMWIGICDEDFHCFASLARLLQEAFLAADSESDTTHIDARWLRTAFKHRAAPTFESVPGFPPLGPFKKKGSL